MIKHVKTGFFVMSKVNLTVMNICGEEKFVLGSDEIEGDNVIWKLIYRPYNDDFEIDIDRFLTDRWWEPQTPTGNYIPPNTSAKDPFFCSKPSTSREIYEPGPSKVPFALQKGRRNIPESFVPQWVEVQPGLHKFFGPPGCANESLENPEEFFTRIKNKTVVRTKKESQQTEDHPESIRNQDTTPQSRRTKAMEELSTWPKSKASERKKHADNAESTVDFMKKLNPKMKLSDDFKRDNKFAKEPFVWPKAPEITSAKTKPVLDNAEKIIDAIKKRYHDAEMSAKREQNNSQLNELIVWPSIPDANTSSLTKDIIKKLKAEMMDYNKSDYIPTKLPKDHDNKNKDPVKSNTFVISGLPVPRLGATAMQNIDKEMNGFLKSKVDSLEDTEDVESLLLKDGFWDFFDSDNTQLMYEDHFDVDSKKSTVDEAKVDKELEENVQVGATVNSRIEEGQGDVCPEPEDSDKNK